MKSRGGLGRECSSSLAFIFSRSFLLRTAPHYLNAWNRLGFVPTLQLLISWVLFLEMGAEELNIVYKRGAIELHL